MPLQQWLPLAFDLLKSLVSSLVWPVTVIVAVWRLGPALVQWLAEKNVHVKALGVTAIITAAREQQERTAAGDNPVAKPALPTPAAAQAPGPAAAAPALPARPALQALEQDIRQQLNQFPQNAREAVLLHALATTRLFGEHEYRYNRIFGSQIAGLKLLDETG